MLRWALGVVLAWCAVGVGAVMFFHPDFGPQPATVVAAPHASVHNALVYRAERDGHFFVDAAVNGLPMRFMVDTGATVVALSPADAERVGLRLLDSEFTLRMATANGDTRVAPVTLREIRLEQLTMADVPAVVMPAPMEFSLLGMSFLSRLAGYGIHDGELTLEW